MSPVPNDIFISYAHIDNQPFGDTKGWVDQLLERLKVRLAQLLGAEPGIWWDGRLQGDQYFVGEIGDHVAATLLLAPVVTPRYVRSDWCRGELKEFYERAHANAQIRNHSRIFKIVKTPVSEEQLPKELRGLLGYVFYELDEKKRPREFRQEIAPNKDQRYWDKLEDLAWDLKRAIEEALVQPDEPAAPAAVSGALPLEKKVYLAETAPELSVERDRIKRELQQHGYYVLPDTALPSNPLDLQRVVREYLSRCVLSVHLLGARFEQSVQFGEPDSMPTMSDAAPPVQLQVEIAAERANADGEFSRLVWLPPGLQTEDARQQGLIEGLQNKLGAGTELLQISLEDLKLRVLEKLTSASSEKRIAYKQWSRVYLIFDNRDGNDVTPINDFLFQHGFEVILPIFEGDSAEVAQYHRESLLNCDAALIYYGSANQMWLRSKIWDLQKAYGWGRESPMLAAIYVSGPQTVEKECFRTREALIIQNFNEFSPDKLQPFLRALQDGNGGQRS